MGPGCLHCSPPALPFLCASSAGPWSPQQAGTFDPSAIDRELGWPESMGRNTLRVFSANPPAAGLRVGQAEPFCRPVEASRGSCRGRRRGSSLVCVMLVQQSFAVGNDWVSLPTSCPAIEETECGLRERPIAEVDKTCCLRPPRRITVRGRVFSSVGWISIRLVRPSAC